MTDKEQIIIDGIQFNEFGVFYIDYDLNGKFQSISSSAKEYKILKFLIEQLARKTQECKELKKTVLTKCPNCNSEYLTSKGIELYEENKKLKKECEELKEKLRELELKNTTLQNRNQQLDSSMTKADRYRKALEEIEEYAKENDEMLQGYHHEWANNRQILEIINKAEGE